MTEGEVIGVIIQASCPGGIYSNIVSYYLDGNIHLRLVANHAKHSKESGNLLGLNLVYPNLKRTLVFVLIFYLFILIFESKL